jgi:hypothetical protein
MGFVVLALLCEGYEWGVADHSIHILFADLVIHPHRWQGDLLAEAARSHPSLFWLLQAPITATLPAPWAAAALHLAVLFATGWAVLGLLRALGASPGTEAAGLLLAAVAWPAVGGAPTMDPLLLPRGAALPLELLALRLLLDGRSAAAFGVAGAAVSIHAPSGTACVAAMAAALGAERDPRRLGWAAAAALVGAAPVLVWWGASGALEPEARIVDEAWAIVLDRRLAHHLDPRVWPARDGAITAVFVLAGLAAARTATLRWVIVGGVLYGVGGVALGQAGVAVALQLEPGQAARLLVVFGGLAAASRIPIRLTPRVGLALVLTSAAVGRWPPDGERAHFHPQGHDGEEQAFARTLRDLPLESLVMVPPHRFGDARVHGRRALFVTWKDGGEALFDRGQAMEWKRRIESACACRPLDEPLAPHLGPGGRLAELRRRMADGVGRAGRERLLDIAREERVTHLVVETEHGFELIEVP